MKVLVAAAALMLTIGAMPVFAGEAAECVSGRFHEPLCGPKIWHRGRTVVVTEREPDAVMLPRAPYVVVNWPHR
jgi:hypothetical protein